MTKVVISNVELGMMGMIRQMDSSRLVALFDQASDGALTGHCDVSVKSCTASQVDLP
jgi:hypothetical protein